MPPRPEVLVGIAVLAPFLGAAIIGFLDSRRNLREAATLATAAVLFIAVALLNTPVLGGARPVLPVLAIAPGLSIAFAVEPLGMLFALVASSLWVVNSVYSIGYMRANDEPRQTTFYVCFALALGSTVGVAFAGNLFTLFLFYEALTLVTFPLVTHRRDAAALRAGRLYLALLLGSSLLLFLPTIVATWVIAGTLDFTPGGILADHASPGVIALLLALYIFGIGKAAVMPMHFWLPTAMVAPTPVSALLHAVAVVKAGVFSVAKVAVYIFGIDTLASTGQSAWLTIVAGTTIITASIIALRQDDLKRRLAYSTVSQLSYIILGVAILAPVSLVGAAVHIAAHAVAKITLFFAAGSIYTAAHLTQVSQLDGIGLRMPWTMGAFTVASLAMIGLPPTAGFLGKWLMLVGAMETSNWIALAVIVASTVLNACYFVPIVYRAFFRAPAAELARAGVIREAPLPMVAALALTAAASVLLFLMPQLALALGEAMVGGTR